MNLNCNENFVLGTTLNYLESRQGLEPEYLGEFESHQDVGADWKGYFAMWLTEGEKAVCTNFSKLALLVEAVSLAVEVNLTEQEHERVCGTVASLVEQKWLLEAN